jgi:hypothetical protein
MRKWGIYSLADSEMCPGLHDSEEQAWQAIEECGADADLTPVPVLLTATSHDERQDEAETAPAVFKVELLSSRDFEARRRNINAPVTVLLATVRAQDPDEAARTARGLCPDTVVLATYQRRTTEAGCKAAVWPERPGKLS